MSDNIPRFSYSQLQTWNRCHFSWYLNYDQKWATVETKSYFIEGNIFHDLVMVYYKNIPLTDHDSCVRLVKQRVGEYRNAAASDPAKLQLVANMARVVKNYLEFARHEDMKWDILDAEKHFDILLKTPKGREFYLQGYIDILAREKETGRLYVWDHKTYSKTPWSETMVMMDSQIFSYVAALRLMNIPIFGLIVNQVNKYEYKDPQMDEKLFKRAPAIPTDQELYGKLHAFTEAVDELLDCQESGVYRRNLHKDCASCFYQEPCLTLLRAPEIPIEAAMQVNFKKKEEKRALI